MNLWGCNKWALVALFLSFALVSAEVLPATLCDIQQDAFQFAVWLLDVVSDAVLFFINQALGLSSRFNCDERLHEQVLRGIEASNFGPPIPELLARDEPPSS